jgi:hypothetical protein
VQISPQDNGHSGHGRCETRLHRAPALVGSQVPALSSAIISVVVVVVVRSIIVCNVCVASVRSQDATADRIRLTTTTTWCPLECAVRACVPPLPVRNKQKPTLSQMFHALCSMLMHRRRHRHRHNNHVASALSPVQVILDEHMWSHLRGHNGVQSLCKVFPSNPLTLHWWLSHTGQPRQSH